MIQKNTRKHQKITIDHSKKAHSYPLTLTLGSSLFFFIFFLSFLIEREPLKSAILFIGIVILFFSAGSRNRRQCIPAEEGSVDTWKLNVALPPLLLLIIAALSVYQAIYCPVFAWDGLDFWLEKSKEIITEQPAPPSSNYLSASARHPDTVSYLASIIPSINHKFGLQLPSFTWILASLLLAMGAYGFSIYLNNSKVISTLLSYVTVSVPLLENHILIQGYAEIWVTVAIFYTTIWLAISAIEVKISPIIAACISAFVILYLKNTGILYFTCVIFALCILASRRIDKRLFFSAFIIGITLIAMNFSSGHKLPRSSETSLYWSSEYITLKDLGCLFIQDGDTMIAQVSPSGAAQIPANRLWENTEVIATNEYSLLSEDTADLCSLHIALPSYPIKYVKIRLKSKNQLVKWQSIISPSNNLYAFFDGIITIQTGKKFIIGVAGRFIPLEFNDWIGIPKSFFRAFWQNASFQLYIPLLFGVASCLLSSKRQLPEDELKNLYLLPLFISFLVFIVIILGVLFSTHFFNHSLPSQDRVFSRSVVPIAPLIVLSVILLTRSTYLFTQKNQPAPKKMDC